MIWMLSEEGKVHAAVGAVSDEMGMCREVLSMAVLENEEATRREERGGGRRRPLGNGNREDKVRELFQLRKGVRRVSKDEVVSARSLAKETEDIGTKECDVSVGTKGVYELADEGDVLRIELYGSDVRTAPRKQFEGDATCAGKEIKGYGRFNPSALNTLNAFKVDV